MKGPTAGTANQSAYMFLTGANTMSKQQFAAMHKAGLIDMSKVSGDLGGRVNIGPGGIVGSKEYTGKGNYDLVGWAQNVLEPALKKLSKGDMADYDSYVSKIGRNRNVMRMLTMFMDPGFQAQIAKDVQQWQQALPVDQAYSNAVKNNPKFVKAGFSDQFTSMMEAIGAPLSQAAIPAMKAVTDFFTHMGAIAKANPGAIQKIGAGLALVSGAFIRAGAIAIMAAIGPAGWLLVGIAALGAALIAFAPKLTAMIQSIGKWDWVSELQAKFNALHTQVHQSRAQSKR